ncbi:hypothetical protein pb186bvf_009081 [Paramecium bursaria]
MIKPYNLDVLCRLIKLMNNKLFENKRSKKFHVTLITL